MLKCLNASLDIFYIGVSVNFSRTEKKNNNEIEQRIRETVEYPSLSSTFPHTLITNARKVFVLRCPSVAIAHKILKFDHS